MNHVVSIIFFPMSISFMSHVDFKKWPCRPVKLKGQGPYHIFIHIYKLICICYTTISSLGVPSSALLIVGLCLSVQTAPFIFYFPCVMVGTHPELLTEGAHRAQIAGIPSVQAYLRPTRLLIGIM